ncbi:hypothetical protein SYNPS1DRAFT_28946 [Syncephalis pseudoplumigaleata]|uniref:Uncharacterized protein n=1 Tax=Syncephalis pseudoplumigaleata TaxID=1712513 RepID=A0A4V1J1J9_9FUNG|nr:hypothetical protein SYNPS1DRAFT_28946 [Syncephalis pseudoplumigaleata]|eukprot:RKP25319.1 hypothetical protein SYNPS1DRAFT_28946 [Syncephalis pseudoplumigaleata]
MRFSISTLLKATALTVLLAATVIEAAPTAPATDEQTIQLKNDNEIKYEKYDEDNLYGTDGTHFTKIAPGKYRFKTCALRPDIQSNIGAAMHETREGVGCNSDRMYSRKAIYLF